MACLIPFSLILLQKPLFKQGKDSHLNIKVRYIKLGLIKWVLFVRQESYHIDHDVTGWSSVAWFANAFVWIERNIEQAGRILFARWRKAWIWCRWQLAKFTGPIAVAYASIVEHTAWNTFGKVLTLRCHTRILFPSVIDSIYHRC